MFFRQSDTSFYSQICLKVVSFPTLENSGRILVLDLLDRCGAMATTMAMSGAAVAGGCAVLGDQCCHHQFVVTMPSLSLPNRAGYKGSVKQQRSVVRAGNAEGPLRRPSAPGATPSIATSPAPPSPPTSDPSPSPSPQSLTSTPATKVTPSKSTAVSIEYQRQRAKELQEYFLDKKYEEKVRADRIFGWTRKNEITNGRWSMFGIAVGMLTEYATGSDFVEQLKIIISNLGIAELD